MSELVTLTPESVEAIAERVAELLRGEPTGPELIDAAEVARRFTVSRDYVYEHATELGAIRLGSGPKARLRFDPERVADALAPRPAPVTDPHPRRARSRAPRSAPVELLPIGRRQ